VHGLDVVAGAVEQIIRIGVGRDKMRLDQREIGIVQPRSRLLNGRRPPCPFVAKSLKVSRSRP
jgi:hypothetical protein